MRANARPEPVFGARSEFGSNRIERNVARRRHQMRLVHRNRAVARLEQVSADAQPRIDHAGVAPVRLAERPPEPLGRRRRQDQMDVVRHEAVRPDRHTSLAAALAQEIQIETIILVAEERLHPPIAALRDVMGQLRHDETGDAGQWRDSCGTKTCEIYLVLGI